MKKLLLLTFFICSLKVGAQCNALKITAAEFEHNFVQGDTVVPSADFKKAGDIVKVPGTEHFFTDDHGDATFNEYTAFGKLTKDLFVVLQQDYNENHYYIISNKTDIFQDLAGPPVLYGNSILSIEQEHTDYQIETKIYKLENGSITLLTNLRLADCGVSYAVIASYLKNGYLYVKSSSGTANAYHMIKVI